MVLHIADENPITTFARALLQQDASEPFEPLNGHKGGYSTPSERVDAAKHVGGLVAPALKRDWRGGVRHEARRGRSSEAGHKVAQVVIRALPLSVLAMEEIETQPMENC